MKLNEILRKEILQVVENQINSNNPPETKQSFDRLVKSGIGRKGAKKLIGQCLAVEIFNIKIPSAF